MPEKANALKEELLVWLETTQAMQPIENPYYNPKYDHMYTPQKVAKK